jgi:hypothetical protein
VRHVEAFAGIDVDLVDTGWDDLADLSLFLDLETVLQEWMGHPVAVEVVDVHADLEVGDIDPLDFACHGCFSFLLDGGLPPDPASASRAHGLDLAFES